MDWTQMQPELFDTEAAPAQGLLFDASTVARAADRFGTPDMFAAAEAEEIDPETQQAADSWARRIVAGATRDAEARVEAEARRGGMFARLTNDELVALFNTIKSGRDQLWIAYGHGLISYAAYRMVGECSDILGLIHAENQARPLFG
jgi:hypothetical protein